MRHRKRNILLITGHDDTYRKVLLESQGYCVTPVKAEDALSVLGREEFHFLLVGSGANFESTSTFCKKVRLHHPNLRIGVVAQQGEHVPLEAYADVVIRAQYSPAKFIGAVNTVLAQKEDRD